MQWSRMISVVGAHAEGEIGRVITGGVIDLPGSTVLEKLNYLNRDFDDLRKFALYEPRGCAQMTANLLLPPSHEDADVAFIPMQADGSHAMSGSNSMCVTTVLLETGILPITSPETTVVLDTAAGLVKAIATCENGKVKSVALDMFPSFCEQMDVPLDVDGIGTISVDLAYGGVYYVLVDVREVGLTIEPSSARDLVELGNRIKLAAIEQLSVQHPEIPEFNKIEFLMFVDTEGADDPVYRNATIMPPGRIDRSPCGTGTAARLAVMHARGIAEVGQQLEMRSTINSKFDAQILGTTTVGDHTAVRTRISGRAWVYGMYQLGQDPSDPFGTGFTMADTWGTGIEHVIPGE